MKRVLTIVSHPVGGIRSYLLYTASVLQESGYVFTFLAPQGEAFEAFKKDTMHWNGVEFVDAPVRNGKRSMRPAIRRAIRNGRFSLIFSQGLRAGTQAALANLWTRIPHLLTLHDVIVPQNDVPGRFKWLKKRCIGHITRGTNVIVPVSNDCARYYLRSFPEWKRSRCRVEVIHNGIDVERISRGGTSNVDPNSLRRELGLGQDVLLAGFFGRFMAEKGFLVLLESLREIARRGYVDRVRLVAVRDPHGYRDQYVAEVRRDEMLSRMVRFVEPVAEIAPLLSQMDLLVVPSLWEACPLLPMEAMVLGVPVLGSDCIGLREVLRETPCVVVPRDNPLALADSLVRAISNGWKREAAEFISEAKERFNVRRAAERLGSLFDAIANGTASSRSERSAMASCDPSG